MEVVAAEAEEPWDDLWARLVAQGWTHEHHPRPRDHLYMPPGVHWSEPGKSIRRDFFDSRKAVRSFIKSGGSPKSPPVAAATGVATRAKAGPRTRAPKEKTSSSSSSSSAMDEKTSPSEASRWDAAQDAELTRLVRKLGTNDWEKMAAAFSTARTASALRNRWYSALAGDASATKAKGGSVPKLTLTVDVDVACESSPTSGCITGDQWSKAEDAELANMVRKEGPGAWASKANSWRKAAGTARTGSSLRNRWIKLTEAGSSPPALAASPPERKPGVTVLKRKHAEDTPHPSEKRIAIWNRVTQRVCAGKSAPMQMNLQSYLEKHPDCEVYTNQNKSAAEAPKPKPKPKAKAKAKPKPRRAGSAATDGGLEGMVAAMISAWEAVTAAKEGDRDRAELFMHLPDPKVYPDYYKVIKKPLALSTIYERISAQYQGSWPSFERDMLRVFTNARTYNTEDSLVYVDANALEQIFRAQPKPPSALAQLAATTHTLEYTFSEDGPLGMELNQALEVIKVDDGGLAQRHDVQLGSRLLSFQGKPLSDLSFEEVMCAIRMSPRPWAMVFEHSGPELEQADDTSPTVTAVVDAQDDEKLSRDQAVIAGDILKLNFTPSLGSNQWDEARKEELVALINASFAQRHMSQSYSVRKLDGWKGNALYRFKCIQRQYRPESWKGRSGLDAGLGRTQKKMVKPNAINQSQSILTDAEADALWRGKGRNDGFVPVRPKGAAKPAAAEPMATVRPGSKRKLPPGLSSHSDSCSDSEDSPVSAGHSSSEEGSSRAKGEWSKSTATQLAAELKHDDIAKLFGFSLSEAAQRAGLGRTLFKKVCRREGIEHWPGRASPTDSPKHEAAAPMVWNQVVQVRRNPEAQNFIQCLTPNENPHIITAPVGLTTLSFSRPQASVPVPQRVQLYGYTYDSTGKQTSRDLVLSAGVVAVDEIGTIPTIIQPGLNAFWCDGKLEVRVKKSGDEGSKKSKRKDITWHRCTWQQPRKRIGGRIVNDLAASSPFSLSVVVSMPGKGEETISVQQRFRIQSTADAVMDQQWAHSKRNPAAQQRRQPAAQPALTLEEQEPEQASDPEDDGMEPAQEAQLAAPPTVPFGSPDASVLAASLFSLSNVSTASLSSSHTVTRYEEPASGDDDTENESSAPSPANALEENTASYGERSPRSYAHERAISTLGLKSAAEESCDEDAEEEDEQDSWLDETDRAGPSEFMAKLKHRMVAPRSQETDELRPLWTARLPPRRSSKVKSTSTRTGQGRWPQGRRSLNCKKCKLGRGQCRRRCVSAASLLIPLACRG